MPVVLGDPPRSQLCWWCSWVRPPCAARCPSGLGHGRPLLPSASRAQAKMPLFLNLRTMPGRHSLPQRTERADGLGATFSGPAPLTFRQVPRGNSPLSLGASASRVLPGPRPVRPLPGWDKPAHHGLNEAHLLCSGPTGPVPGVVSGPRTPGPSDSLTLQPTGSQDQAEQRAPSGRLPSAQRP